MNRRSEGVTDLNYLFIGKTKLPKGLSFPIKRAALDEFLRCEGITKVTGVGFLGNSGHNGVLTANYYGPRSKSSRHTLNLSIYAVASDIRRQVEVLIVREAFPRLAEWLRSFSDDTLLRTRTDHSMLFGLEGITVTGAAAETPVSSSDLRLMQYIDRDGKLN